MENRSKDLFIGLSIGYYLNPTISILGIEIPWVLIGLGIILMIAIVKKVVQIVKKLATFLWLKLINEIKKELNI